MHELPVNACRIDLAFVGEDSLCCVEIKSSRDTLDRLGRQMDEFNYCLPQVWLAVAPKYAWKNRPAGTPYIPNEIIVDGGKIIEQSRPWKRPDGERNWHVLSAMPMLLHVAENRRVCERYSIKIAKRAPQRVMMEAIARNLSGDQIEREVCRELRARRTGWVADAPIAVAA
jgi:hypothetical protein